MKTEKALKKILDESFKKGSKAILIVVEPESKVKVDIYRATRNLYPYEVLGLLEDCKLVIEEGERKQERR